MVYHEKREKVLKRELKANFNLFFFYSLPLSYGEMNEVRATYEKRIIITLKEVF